MAQDKTSIPPEGRASAPALDALRRRIDEIDDGMHDLLMRRAALVEEVASVKRAGGSEPLRPGREAQILRRLVGRHRGRFPRASLVRLWREIMGGAIAMQAELTVAVSPGCWDLARDHFGSEVPMIQGPSADEVTIAVAEGRSTLGVLPLEEDGDCEPWWLALALLEEHRPHVVARLPFGMPGNAVAECGDAFVIAAMAPEPSGDDCTLVAITAAGALDTARLTNAFLAARINANPVAVAERNGGTAVLVEVEALLADGDRNLAQALASVGGVVQVTWLGAYARPLPDAAMGGVAPV